MTTGLYLDLGNDQLFGSHGSIVFASTTPVDYLTVGFTGSGTINASGLLAEGGAIFSGLSEDLVISGSKVPGDTDGDGDVDLLDLDALGANFGLATGATCAEGDFDGDGDVDLLDLDILGANFGTTPSASVPEPTALALAALAGVALLGRRI